MCSSIAMRAARGASPLAAPNAANRCFFKPHPRPAPGAAPHSLPSLPPIILIAARRPEFPPAPQLLGMGVASWELGNEPDLWPTAFGLSVSGTQLATDMNTLMVRLRSFDTSNSRRPHRNGLGKRRTDLTLSRSCLSVSAVHPSHVRPDRVRLGPVPGDLQRHTRSAVPRGNEGGGVFRFHGASGSRFCLAMPSGFSFSS